MRVARVDERDSPKPQGDRCANEHECRRVLVLRYDVKARRENARDDAYDTKADAWHAPRGKTVVDLMAPPRKRISKLGELLRAVRGALHVDQKTFAAMIPVSDRTLSRWENGFPPQPEHLLPIVDACEQAPGELHDAVAELLGVELEDPAPPPTPVLAAPAPAPPPAPVAAPPAHIEPPRPSTTELRAALDAIVYAAAEERDVLPRHLRAFGVELLQAAARLGLTASEAASLVAARERAKVHALGSVDLP